MIAFIFLVTTFTATVLIVGGMITYVEYGTHIDQVKQFTKPYGKASYNAFVEEFEKHSWQQSNVFKNSLFDYPNNSEIHASIIKFNGVGMIMKSPIEYWKMWYYMRQYFKNKNIVKEYIWE